MTYKLWHSHSSDSGPAILEQFANKAKAVAAMNAEAAGNVSSLQTPVQKLLKSELYIGIERAAWSESYFITVHD